MALLADPATHGGAAVERIDTHAASVFLAGDRAFKVKRAVRFPFLDYSTLEKRKRACEAELEVNRAFAPDIYLRVVPITRAADGRLALDGDGPPVEWAVEMRRFDEKATLDHLADAGRIDAALADALGRAVAAAHAGAPAVEAGPWIHALADYIEQNDAAFRERPELFPPPERNAPSRRRAAPPMGASVRSSSRADGAGSSAADTATCISAISFLSTAGPYYSTPSSSIRWWHRATCSTISPSC